MNAPNLHITKASGVKATFSIDRLKQSLLRSGANEEIALAIADEVSSSLYEGISTKKIYRKAFNLLKERSSHLAARYHLKAAIMELGPSGFPFEKYVAAILRYEGFAVKVDEIVRGKCVNHEIDIIAEKDNQHFMIECKYHNQRGTVSDVKIPLYIQARFKDVEAAWINISGHESKFHQGWVVTNTKFSTDAIEYGACAGLNLIGWDYPYRESLKDRIDRMGLYPITCLTTLTKQEKNYLLESKIVLCKEICENPDWLKKAGISDQRISRIIEEGKMLCKNLIAHDKH